MHIQFITNLPKRNGVHPDTSLQMDREEVNPMQKAITKGFTLIELLVVIAIIGILAAVVLVAINPAERINEANDSKHKSNLGQVATAIESCYTANGGSYANCIDAANDTTQLQNGSYLKNPITDVTVGGTATSVSAYAEVFAKSNGGGCASGQHAYLKYSSSTGQTSTIACSATAPTYP